MLQLNLPGEPMKITKFRNISEEEKKPAPAGCNTPNGNGLDKPPC
jgi:hypothetical protein